MDFKRFIPFTDLRGYSGGAATKDMLAALAVTFMAVPQGVAYAVIAGLPPAMGLYAAAVPTIVGSMMRSSKHVVTGPTNAVSLLVGGGVAAMAGVDPVTIGITLALMVGLFQFFAGALRLGSVVDYISNPVVLGYITGAGLLIGIGQLPSVTATAGARGNVFDKISFWISGLGETSGVAVAMALGTAAVIMILRKINKNIPGAIIALGAATAVTYFLDLHTQGMQIVSDLTPVPSGLPAITIPDLELFGRLAPLAVACTVLSLVESSAVARAIAATTGQRLDTSVEFAGQGLANIVAGFLGAYPTSGSLSRSALNHESGAESRLGGVYAGIMMLAVLLVLGPVVNYTPIAALAGLLVVVAIGLVNVSRIKVTMKSRWSDRAAFLVTLFGTWFLPLDKAIYLGVGISIFLFLRQARLLVVSELQIDRFGRFQEVSDDDQSEDYQACEKIRVLHVEGHLFFGVVGELQTALDDAILDEDVKVIILRMKRTRGMDVSVATTLEAAAVRLAEQGRFLLLAGVRPDILDVLKRTAIDDAIGHEMIFPSQSKWFESLNGAIRHGMRLIEDDVCENCPHNVLNNS